MDLVQGTHKFQRRIEIKKTRRRARRVLAVLVAGILVISLGAYTYLARVQYVVAAELSEITMPAAEPVDIPWPATGMAAIGAVGQGLLADSGTPDQVVPIASITKLITAATVLEKKPLTPGQEGETITFTAADEGLYNNYRARGGAVVPTYTGQQITQYDALQALLLPSANNMADILAIWAFDSMNGYLKYANNWAESKGLSATTVADASGFSPATTSSLRDLVKLADIALNHPVIQEIVRRPRALLPGIGMVQSTNKLLGQDGIIGGKTGMTDEARDCFLSIARHRPGSGEEVLIIIAVLGQPSRPETFAQTLAVLDAAKRGFTATPVLSAGQIVGHIRTPWGTEVPIQADTDIDIVRWKQSRIEVEPNLPDITAGQPSDYQLGTVTIQNGGALGSSTVSLAEPLDKPSIWWRLKDALGLAS